MRRKAPDYWRAQIRSEETPPTGDQRPFQWVRLEVNVAVDNKSKMRLKNQTDASPSKAHSSQGGSGVDKASSLRSQHHRNELTSLETSHDQFAEETFIERPVDRRLLAGEGFDFPFLFHKWGDLRHLPGACS